MAKFAFWGPEDRSLHITVHLLYVDDALFIDKYEQSLSILIALIDWFGSLFAYTVNYPYTQFGMVRPLLSDLAIYMVYW